MVKRHAGAKPTARKGVPVWHDRHVVPRTVTRAAGCPVTGWRRLVRVAALGVSCYGLAVAAHVGAGGGGPGWLVSVILACLLGLLGVVLTTRRRGLPSLLLTLTTVQAGLHWLFGVIDGPSMNHSMGLAMTCAAPAAGQHHMAAACTSAAAASTGSSQATSMADSMAAPMVMPSVPMLVAHLAATVATAWLLARGEAWLWRTIARLFWMPTPASPHAIPGVTSRYHQVLIPAARQANPAAPRAPPGLDWSAPAA